MLDAGMLSAIIGSSVGLAGGAFGTWMSIRNTPPGLQRTLMVKASIVCWVFILSFVALVFLLPTPWKWWLWVLYGPALLFFIYYVNKGLANARRATQKPLTH